MLTYNGNEPKKILYNDSNISKLLYNNTYVYKGLPSDYERVEYLESTGTQYIDTGLTLSSGYEFKFRTMWVNYKGLLFGANSTNKETMLGYSNLNLNYLGRKFYI